MPLPRNSRSLPQQHQQSRLLNGGDGEGVRNDSVDGRCCHCQQQDPNPMPQPSEGDSSRSDVSGGRDLQARLAIYIAMAHGGLALSLAFLYGLSRLLEQYWRPIQWALLLSIPLRELHTALVSFWSHPLRLGLPETLLALPLAVLRTTASSLFDSHSALLRLLRRPTATRTATRPTKLGFSKLMQWLVSFALFVLVYERLGLFLSLLAFATLGLVASSTRSSTSPPATVAATLTAIHSRRQMIPPPSSSRSPLAYLSRYLTSILLKRLKTIVGIGLITVMILGSISGLVFFSYKIGIEGKDAMISVKTRLEEHNYAERIGLKQWMDDHNVPELIESCTSKFYDTVSQYADSLALQYNATEIVDGLRRYLIRPPDTSPNTSHIAEQSQHWRFSKMMHQLQLRLQNRQWSTAYAELNRSFWEFLSVIATDDLVEKVKGLALRSVHVSKQVFASSTVVLAGGANLFFSVVVSLVSGAAGLLNFLSQLTVFFWLLYYLITSDSAGVMNHILEMLPISKTTRERCAEVLDQAVSSVLLAAVKVALFEGCLTYLLFRFYRIHFLYVSTFLAWASAIFPITPTWLSSIPAAVQLAMEARYVEAVLLTSIHLMLLEYGTAVIQEEIPGQNAYLTGLSILGGIALFPSVLEGAIMGPLLMTIMIAVKNLYAEFVLSSAKLKHTQLEQNDKQNQ